METNAFAASIPFYYPTDHSMRCAFRPFIVAPLGDFQDTLIFGPQFVSKAHEEFLEQLYFSVDTNSLSDLTFRLFPFKSHLCVGLLIPTTVKDLGGRSGLILSIGFLVKRGVFRRNPRIISNYLKLLIDLLNRLFSASLPEKGATKLLHQIRGLAHTEHVARLNVVLDSFRLATEIAERHFTYRFWPMLIRRHSRRVPKVIFCSPGARYDELLEIILSEVDEPIRRGGRTAMKQFEGNQGLRTLQLIPLKDLLSNAKGVKMRRLRNRSYLSLY
jgi:hypothetical protein